jgi:hypothetical protein
MRSYGQKEELNNAKEVDAKARHLLLIRPRWAELLK